MAIILSQCDKMIMNTMVLCESGRMNNLSDPYQDAAGQPKRVLRHPRGKKGLIARGPAIRSHHDHRRQPKGQRHQERAKDVGKEGFHAFPPFNAS